MLQFHFSYVSVIVNSQPRSGIMSTNRPDSSPQSGLCPIPAFFVAQSIHPPVLTGPHVPSFFLSHQRVYSYPDLSPVIKESGRPRCLPQSHLSQSIVLLQSLPIRRQPATLPRLRPVRFWALPVLFSIGNSHFIPFSVLKCSPLYPEWFWIK